MMADNPHVIDVGSADFVEQVLERSKTVPVLVDFWAPWCQPCRILGPILEKVAGELEGAVVVAKVNSDENHQLASGFGVQGIPFVVLIKGGKAVDRFVGVRSEAEVHDFLRRHLPSPADDLLADAALLLEAGEIAAARAAFEQALAVDDRCHAARLGLARLALAAGDADAVRSAVDGIPARADEYGTADKLVELAKMAQGAGDGRGVGDPHADTFRRAVGEIASGKVREGLAALLSIAESDRRWNDEAARRAMVAAFQIVGVRDPLSDEFRERLRRIYY